MDIETYFFGVWNANDSGHFLYRPGGRHPEQHTDVARYFGLGAMIDTKLQPADDKRQGSGALHHMGRWTVLTWWDYTGDQRGGCNSSIIASGKHDVEKMLELGRLHFPAQMSRQSVPITCR